MNELMNYSEETFESIKHTNEYGQEFWYARELSKVLEYKDFRNFELLISKAMDACVNSGFEISDHFGEVTEMVNIGSSASRGFPSYQLSRYACYLIVQNGDPRKKVIALGQTYFAVKTRQQELIENYDAMSEEQKRLAIRREIREHNKELAANLFRATQAEAKLRREHIQGKDNANAAHFEVGAKVRQTIKELGGTMPEKLPTPDKSIKQIEREERKKLKD